MKMIVGFVFGLMIASALAQVPKIPGTDIPRGEDILGPDAQHQPTLIGQLKMLNAGVTMNAGVGPDGKMAPVRVDFNGYVICSTDKMK